jgi:hypothetical protein
VVDPNNITDAKNAVKVVLLISGADKRRYRWLKKQLTKKYLLGTEQYPNTLEKAIRILGNYQVAKANLFGEQRGVNLAFNQGGGCRG